MDGHPLRELHLSDSQEPLLSIYRDYLPGSKNIVNIKEMILNERLDVVLVGEGNFTFTMALVSLRGSWKGIISTCLEDQLFDFTVVKLSAVDFCIKNGRELKLDAQNILCNVTGVLEVDKYPETSHIF